MFKREGKPGFKEDYSKLEDEMLERAEETVKDKGEFVKVKREGVLDYKKAGKQVTVYKLKSGQDKNMIDIIPWQVTQEWYAKSRQHSGKFTGAEVGKLDYRLEYCYHALISGNILCLRNTLGKPCIICDEWFDLNREKKEQGDDPKRDKIMKRIFPKWRDVYCVVDTLEPEKGVQLFDISFSCFEKYLRENANYNDEGVIPFSSLKRGKIVSFKGVKKELGKKGFIDCPIIEFVDREKPYHSGIIAETYPLDKMLKVPSQEEVEEIFYSDNRKEDDEERDKEEKAEESKFKRSRSDDE